MTEVQAALILEYLSSIDSHIKLISIVALSGLLLWLAYKCLKSYLFKI